MEKYATELEYQAGDKSQVSYVVESDLVHYPEKTITEFNEAVWTDYIPAGGYDTDGVEWTGGNVGAEQKTIRYPLGFFVNEKTQFFVGKTNLLEVTLVEKPKNNYTYFLAGCSNLKKIKLGSGWKNEYFDGNYIISDTNLEEIKFEEIDKVYLTQYINDKVKFIFPEKCNLFEDGNSSGYVTIPKGVSVYHGLGMKATTLELLGTHEVTLRGTDNLRSLIVHEKDGKIAIMGSGSLNRVIILSKTVPLFMGVMAATSGTLMVPKGMRDTYRNLIVNSTTPYLINPNDIQNWNIYELQ